jgi:hypothetical protein
LLPFAQNQTSSTTAQWTESVGRAINSPKFKGRVPLKLLVH